MARTVPIFDMVFLMERMDLADGRLRLFEAIRGLERAGLQRVADVVAGHAKENVAVDSGHLQDSIKGKVRKRRGRDELTATVSTNTKGPKQRLIRRRDGTLKFITERIRYGYGLDQEIGRTDGTSYAYHPYLRPALQQSQEEIREILREEYARGAVRR